MTADPISAREMFSDWLDGGTRLQLVVARKNDEDVVSPFTTVVQLTSLNETQLQVGVSGTSISLRFLLEVASIRLLDDATRQTGEPEDNPIFRNAEFGTRVRGPWAILMYPDYVAAFAEIP
jgi:hypothetical protein